MPEVAPIWWLMEVTTAPKEKGAQHFRQHRMRLQCEVLRTGVGCGADTRQQDGLMD